MKSFYAMNFFFTVQHAMRFGRSFIHVRLCVYSLYAIIYLCLLSALILRRRTFVIEPLMCQCFIVKLVWIVMFIDYCVVYCSVLRNVFGRN